MNIIGYKFFEFNSEEFIKWQKQEGKKILNIQPFVSGMDGAMGETDIGLKTNVLVFVTYIDKQEDVIPVPLKTKT